MLVKGYRVYDMNGVLLFNLYFFVLSCVTAKHLLSIIYLFTLLSDLWINDPYFSCFLFAYSD